MPKKQPNWLAIERDYCAGVFPLGSICTRHDISEIQLKQFVKQQSLVRENFIEDKKRFLAVIEPDEVRESVISQTPLQEVFTPDELEKAALITASTMVEVHRGDFNRARRELNELATWVMESKRALKPVHREADIKEHGINAKIQSMLLSSYNSYVGGLMKVVQLERQTYDLDSYRGESEESTFIKNQSLLLEEIKGDLEKSIKDLMDQKSAYSGDDETEIYAAELISMPKSGDKDVETN